jgi:2-polyprenyl-6-methoxyphenol hydroxylase-like FAD-dependent oxidoreductase
MTQYDAIVVGTRCAGAPTAMLLARKGYRVLAVDRASFPSDTLSTLLIHQPGVAALHCWGLLDEVLASNCPPFDRYSFDFGPISIAGTPRPADGMAIACAPRRTVLDTILVEAAARAGVQVRERFNVDEVVVEDGTVTGIRGHGPDGKVVHERARVVIGADGRNSHVATAVHATQYQDTPKLQWSYYTFWSDLPVSGLETVIRPHRGWAAIPTNDGLTLLVLGWPRAEADAYRADVEGNYLKTLELAPEFAERVRGATREERFNGGSVPNFLRTPFGAGWALVGDAGSTKDPITAQGISDAFRDAELCAGAIDEWLGGSRTFDEAMSGFHRTRDARELPMFEFTTQLATLEPPPLEMQQLLGAAASDQEAMDDFVSVVAGTLSPTEFFDPANVGRIMQRTAAMSG